MLLDIARGPWLLGSAQPDLVTHRSRFGPVVVPGFGVLVAAADRNVVLGRGGAGFPFATKLRTAASGRALRRHVVVNVSEGEPASSKDAALMVTAPHLVLDGAVMVADALGVRTVHLVVPDEHAFVTEAVTRALAERAEAGEDRRLRWRLHRASTGFVSGESSAVLELIEGRENLPVVSWHPAAVKGLHGQPTLLSNAESFAQLAAVVLAEGRIPGTEAEPGTRLLSITRGNRIAVQEVPHGTRWQAVLTDEELDRPVLIGGYHGQWAPAGALREAAVSVASMQDLGLVLGAGVVIPLPVGACGLTYTAQVTRYLAGESAGRCGPCFNGLPALATAFGDLAAGRVGADVQELADLVRGRGACAHPDGTVRLVSSAWTVFEAEIALHRVGRCSAGESNFSRSA
ncbi:MAG: hypothetical protein NTV23_02490 [Propionibacteriales bacterium]|nr:hypothetical protein [Propionibacteriales bacterium]